MRDALSILDQAISYGNKNIEIDDINGVTGSLNFEKVIALSNAVENKNIHNTLEIVHSLLSSGKEISKIINGLLVFYRDVLLYKSVGDSGYSKYIFEKEEFKEFCNNVNVSKIMYLIDILCDIQSKVKYSTTPNIFLEIALIKMCNVSESDLDILKRITELENKFNNLGNIANIELPSEGFSVDNEKINTLETRINQIVNELNRLELRKQIERIDELKVAINNVNLNSNNNSVEREMQSDISYLKDKISELDLFVKIEDSSSNDDLLEKINLLEEKISNTINNNVYKTNNDMNNEPEYSYNDIIYMLEQLQSRLNDLDDKKEEAVENNNGYSVDLSSVYTRLDELESKENNSFDDEKINEIEETILALKDDVDQLKNKIIENQNKRYESNENISDVSEISEKLMFLERRIYQIVAGELSTKKSNKKEPKKNNGQIMLFGDEILSVADLEQNNKEKIDFDVIQRDEPLVVEEKTVSEEDEVNNETVKFNQEVDTKEEIEVPQKAQEVVKEQPSLFEAGNVIPKVVEEKPVKRVESTYFDIESNSHILVNENSTMVVTPKEEEKVNSMFSSVVKKEQPAETVAPPQQEDAAKDKFASYNIKLIEQLLHDSRSVEARNDKVRIEQVWKNMTRGARPEALSIIETLQTGMVAVVGNKEFVIAFPNVGLCNIVMRPKFKTAAIRVLYNLLGETYNYVALPNDVWSRLSADYKGQYQMGIKYPTLRPLNIPGLEVIKDEYETDTEKIINKTLKLFGEENVKIEE